MEHNKLFFQAYKTNAQGNFDHGSDNSLNKFMNYAPHEDFGVEPFCKILLFNQFGLLQLIKFFFVSKKPNKQQHTHCLASMKTIILLDMDDVIADFNGTLYMQALAQWQTTQGTIVRAYNSDAPSTLIKYREMWDYYYLKPQHPFSLILKQLVRAQNFYLSLAPCSCFIGASNNSVESLIKFCNGTKKPLATRVVQGGDLQRHVVEFELFICTSPSSKNLYSFSEKAQWIEQKLSKEWLKNTIMTKHKAMVKGDYIVDDKLHLFATYNHRFNL